jgi:hypothetical protein
VPRENKNFLINLNFLHRMWAVMYAVHEQLCTC